MIRRNVQLLLVLAAVLLMRVDTVLAADEKCLKKPCETIATAKPAADADSDSDSDADSDKKETEEKTAPYVLRIIKSGEGKPRSDNKSKEGKQDNRRVDVTLTRKVPVEKAAVETRRALFGSGGAVWISKDPTSLDRILAIDTATGVSLKGNKLEAPIEFEFKTNYAHFINRMELLVWDAEASLSSEPLVTVPVNKVAGEGKLEIESEFSSLELSPGLVLQYALRAYDTEDRYDQSLRKKVRFNDAALKKDNTNEVQELSVHENTDNTITDSEFGNLERQSIPIRGSKVRVYGQDLNARNTLTVNGVEVKIGEDGRFGREYLLPEGQHTFDVSVRDKDDEVLEKQLNIDLDSNYFFMVGLADVTAGENKVSGSLEPLAVDEHHYGGDIFVDGRLAFYLKGKVKGKYLVTAQMDTGTEDIGALFDDFHRKDAQSVFRRLDPDQYYPVYGDDSTLIDDTDSQGKLYVRVDWDRSRFLWGNFNTNFTGSEFVPFNRSLYGAQLLHISTIDTSLGDPSHSVNAFASKAQSQFRHNEFLGTGGSLYYLRDTDIVSGSEKVWVEVREASTERVLNKIPLVSGRDYDIDDFQGRLILRRPLLSVASQSGPSIIRDEPLAGNQTYLVVDYEYSPQNLNFDDSSVGVRAKKWVGDHVGVGASWAYEQRAGDDYDIKGVDLTLKRSEQTFIKGEFAQSESAQTSGSFLSDDGGLSFTPFVSNAGATSGDAFGIEARMSLHDFKPGAKRLETGAWYKQQSAGFSTANTDIGVDTTDMGFELAANLSEKVTAYSRAARSHKKGVSTEISISEQIEYAYSDKISVSGELQNNRNKNIAANTNGESTLLAGKVSAQVTDKLNVYGIQQMTLKHSGTEEQNNSTTAGAKYIANEKFSFNGEVSAGDKGNSALLGTEVTVTDTYSLYSNYTYSFNSSQIEKNSIVVGQRKTISNQLKVYSEHQFTDEDTQQSYAHTVGLDNQFTRYTSANLSIQRAVLEDNMSNDTERNTISAGLSHQKDKTRFDSKLEYRWDQGIGIDSRQWVATNRLEYRASPSFRWQGKFNASVTDDRIGIEDARFVEAGLGFAYRPVQHDRLNMLGRITYLNDLQPVSQSTETDQRSLVTSIEGLYDITRSFSAGAKFAYRQSEIRLQRNSGNWIDNDAQLMSARVRYKAHFGIDATAAYHWLSSGATDSSKHGALFTIGRRVGQNLTFSVGYNFTNFDDNLANDSYDVKGWFVNLIGTY